MRIAFLDVDTQYDFMDPAGALHVRGAEALGPNLKRLTEYALARRIPVLASADAHPLLDAAEVKSRTCNPGPETLDPRPWTCE